MDVGKASRHVWSGEAAVTRANDFAALICDQDISNWPAKRSIPTPAEEPRPGVPAFVSIQYAVEIADARG